MSRIGYGHTKQQFLEIVQLILDKMVVIRSNKPGKIWWKLFAGRHPEISLRNWAIATSMCLACIPGAIAYWFSDFEQFLDTHDLKDQACRIWNADESGFPLCPKSGKVVAPSYFRAIYGVTGNTKEQITRGCWHRNSANGYLPWWAISCPINNCVDVAYTGRSPKGWIPTELFYGWIANHFSRHVRVRPVVLLVDGHTRHIDVEISKFCLENEIYHHCLPPHTWHVN